MSDMGWLNLELDDFTQLVDEEELKEIPVDLDTFLTDKYYLGGAGIKNISPVQRQIIEGIAQIYKLPTLIKIHGEEVGQKIWDETYHEIVAMCGKGGGKDFSSRIGFAYSIYKLHCLRDPIGYYNKAQGTYIDLLNIAINADQARDVFFKPLNNILSASPYFQERGFEPRKSSLEFYECPIRLFSGNSEAESWEGLDLLLVVLDEIAAFKGLGPNVPVLTPDGWVKNGDLRVGDKVIGADGKATSIQGVFPMGQKEVFEIEFEDGETAQCSEDHIWNVDEYSDGRRKTNKNLQLKDFKSLELKGKWNQKRYSIPVVQPVEFNSLGDLPIDPYVMGILLSEGSLRGKVVSFANGDDFIVEEVKCRLPGYEIKTSDGVSWRINNSGKLKAQLEELGLWGHKADTKFIPELYLRASVNERKMLLRGLMDGDGTVARGHGSYKTVSDNLARDVIELCRSLGGVPMGKRHPSWYPNENGNRIQCLDAWNISPRVPFNPFFLPRKAEKFKLHKRTLKRSIVDVRSLGYEEEMTCIKVANDDGLYVINDYVVTHNTDSQFQKSGGGAQRLSASGIYDMSKNSVVSRFADIGKTILLSFPRFQGDFICQRYEETENDPNVLRIKAPTWVMNPYVTRESLEPQFIRNPIQAKMRFGCEPPEMIDAFFRDPAQVRRCFRGDWEIKNKGELTEKVVYHEIPDLFPINDDGTIKPWFKAEDDHTRYIHVDLGLKRDRAAICMVHSPGVRNIEVEEGVFEKLPVVKMDLVHFWEASEGKEIDFQNIREFIKLLARKFPVGLVTYDRWQSVDTIQILKKRGINCDTHSVKRNDYDTLSTAFYDGRFSGYFHKILVEDELLKLQVLDNGKVDHPEGLHDDLAQALASAVWNCCEFADLDMEIDISILGDEEDWETLEYAEALEEEQRSNDGRRNKKVELTYDEDDAGFDFISI